MRMRRFLKYFESIEAFNNKKRSVGPSNNEYIDLDGDTVYGPNDIEILWDDICFIEASSSNPLPRIYTHGAYYTGETLPLDIAYTSYTHGFADALDVSYAVKSKQDTLISGTNIKTVGYISLLGEGNIEIPSYIGDGNTIAVDENNMIYALMDQSYGVASYNSYSKLSYNFTYFANYIDNKASDINDKFDVEILDINRSIDDISYVFSKITTNHEVRIENLENKPVGHDYSYAAYINISPSYVISTNHTTLATAYESGIDGLATALDVAYAIKAIPSPDFTCETIVPTTTNFEPGTQYSIQQSLQRTANLFAGEQGEIDDINDKIPSQATSQNQLADKAFVNSTVATNAANFRGNWSTWTNVPTNASMYPEDYTGSRTPTNNDYMVVNDASDYNASNTGTWRFMYIGDWTTLGKTGWKPQYKVGNSFTAAQQAALDSGITSVSVAQIGTNTTAINSLQTDKLDKVYSSGKKIYGVASDGSQKMYTAGTNVQFNDDGTISATDTVYDDTALAAQVAANTTAISGKAPLVHTHTVSDVTNLQSYLDSKQHVLTNSSYITISNSYVLTANTNTIRNAYLTHTDGLATAYDVAYELVKDEIAISAALNNSDIRITNVESDLQTKQHALTYTSYINISNSYVLSTVNTTLDTAYNTGVDGLATAYDVACNIHNLAETTNSILSSYNTRINALEHVDLRSSYLPLTGNTYSTIMTGDISMGLNRGIKFYSESNTSNDYIKYQHTTHNNTEYNGIFVNMSDDIRTSLYSGIFKVDVIYNTIHFSNNAYFVVNNDEIDMYAKVGPMQNENIVNLKLDPSISTIKTTGYISISDGYGIKSENTTYSLYSTYYFATDGSIQKTGILSNTLTIHESGKADIVFDGSSSEEITIGSGTVTKLNVNGTDYNPVSGVVTFSTPDTRNTAGNTTSSSKMYLTGVTSTGGSFAQTFINTNVYSTNGGVYGAAFYETSDARLKNIHGDIDINKAYNILDKCSTIIYDLKDDQTHKEQIGLIAQEVEEFFPEIVSTDEYGFKSIDYSRLTVILLRLIKDLSVRINKLEEK